MRKKIEQKEKAREMRMNGLSIIEIAKLTGCSKSSISMWVRDISLTVEQNIKLSRRKYEKTAKCPECNNLFERTRKNRKNKFCSFECFAKSAKRKILFNTKKQQQCLYCGKSCMNKFCSFECSISNHWSNRMKKTNETGLLPARQGTAKAILLKMRDHKCEICKRTTWNNTKIPLVMDHINGDHNDWRINNLRLICGNCDMLLPTYKSKNRGQGRFYDKEYRKKYYHRTKEACPNGMEPLLKSGKP